MLSTGSSAGAATGIVGGTRVDVATAYFNVGGYMLIADSLDAARETRLLLGAIPETVDNRPRKLSSEPSIARHRAADTPQRGSRRPRNTASN